MSRIDDAPRARRYEASFVGSVAILAWPEEAEQAAELARAGRPRLLLVSRSRLGSGSGTGSESLALPIGS